MTNLNEIQRMIDAAVLKGQFEVIESLYRQTVNVANMQSTTSNEAVLLNRILEVFGTVSLNLRRQLDYVATEESK